MIARRWMPLAMATVLVHGLAGAQGQWLRVDAAAATHDTYIEPEPLWVQGPTRRVLVLHDLKAARPNGDRSVRFVAEVDCAQGRLRELEEHTFGGPMATGPLTSMEREQQEWQDSRQPAARALIRAACTGSAPARKP